MASSNRRSRSAHTAASALSLFIGLCCSLLLNACADRAGEEAVGSLKEANELLNMNAALLEMPYSNSEARRLVNRLSEIVRTSEAHVKEPSLGVLTLLADFPLGASLFESLYRERSAESKEKAAEFLSGVKGQCPPESAVAAAALACELDVLAESSPDEFERRCSEVMARQCPSSSKSARVVCVKHASHLERQGACFAAAREGLYLWKHCPEAVKAARLARQFESYLRVAGLPLLADMMATGYDPNQLASAVDALLAVRSTDQQASSLAEWLKLPVGPCGEPAAIPIQQPVLEALAAAERGRQGVQDLSGDTAAKEFSRYVDSLDSLLKDIASLSDAELLLLQSSAKVVLDSSGKLADELEWRKDPLSPQYTGLHGKLKERARISVSAIFAHRARGAAQGVAGGLVTVVDEWVAFCQEEEDNKGLIAAYQAVSELNPELPQAPEYLLRLARLYVDDLKVYSEGVATCQQIVEKYPDSPQALQGRLVQARSLVSMENYGDAYTVLQEFLAVNPSGSGADVAQYLLAVTEEAEGATDEAAQRMQKVAADYPDSPIAPRALEWAWTTRYSHGDFNGAKAILGDLVERYPQTAQGIKAQQVMARLQENGQ